MLFSSFKNPPSSCLPPIATAAMAVIDRIEVTVRVDHEDLIEYEDDQIENDDPKRVTRYIEATNGKAFSIKIRAQAPYQWTSECLAADIKIDGGMACHPLYKKKLYAQNPTKYYETRDGTTVQTPSGEQKRPWVFSKVNQGQSIT